MKNQNDSIKAMLEVMVHDFNNYSELVALNHAQLKEGNCEEGTLQWNRGHLNQIEDYMKMLAENAEVGLRFECKTHTFGYDDWARELEYRTVRIVELRRLNAEWISYMKAYRLYDPRDPQSTIGFVKDISEAENSETRVTECDIDTMHVECF